MPAKSVKIKAILKGGAKAINDFGYEPKMAIGSYFKKDGIKVAKGLNDSEIRTLMPAIIDLMPEDRDFFKEVEKFFIELTLKIPVPNGLTLEIGQEYEAGQPLSVVVDKKQISNMPLNTEHYIWYRFIKEHPLVASSFKEASQDPMKKFYIEDSQLLEKQAVDKVALEKQALSKYFEIDEDAQACKMYLTLMGTATSSLSASGYKVALKEKVSQNPELFLEVFNDTHKEKKYKIKEFLSSGVLREVGTNILIAESNTSIGNDMLEAVLYLGNAGNSDTLRMLEARHKESMKTKVG